jgi:hypothetical protein
LFLGLSRKIAQTLWADLRIAKPIALVYKFKYYATQLGLELANCVQLSVARFWYLEVRSRGVIPTQANAKFVGAKAKEMRY